MFDKNELSEKINDILTNNKVIDDSIIAAIKQKRGRKSNKELELLKKYNDLKNIEPVNKPQKKRGRKPKGGKLIKPNINSNMEVENKTSNIILHLKCNSNDLNETQDFLSEISYNPNIENIQAFDEYSENKIKPQFFTIEVNNDKTINQENDNKKYITPNVVEKDTVIENDISIKIIWQKLKELRNKFNKNSINDKKSSCFWCTCEFDWPPVHIPKAFINNSYDVYGCFCMPECGAGYLFSENLDTSTKWERYAMLNNLYVDIYNYKDNVKPAPDPRYLLNKYYGDLSIEEYRLLIRKCKHRMMVVNKPLTHVLPELVEDSIDNSSKNNNLYRLSRKKPSYNKLKTDDKSWAF